jgi:VIT1/CCC1 family predicted Fe2+/Mn2+ transporter
LLGVGYFAERYGAMHLQLYSITNHIVWHTVTAWTGSIFLIVSFLLIKTQGYLAFPIAKIVAYLGFYSWYCAKYSYKKFSINFLRYESQVLMMPVIVFIFFGLWWVE